MAKKVHCKKCGSTMRKIGSKWFDGAHWECNRFPNDPMHNKPWYHTNDMRMGTSG